MLLELFDAWMRERARIRKPTAAATVKGYRNDLTLWAKALVEDVSEGPRSPLEQVSVTDLTPERVAAAWERFAASSYSDRTLRRMLASLRGLVAYCRRHDLLDLDPTEDLPQPGRSPALPRALDDSGLGRLVAAVRNPPPSARGAWPARDLALVALMAGCGFRASEVVSITPASIDRDELWRITVVGKGTKERTVPAAAEVARTVDTFLQERAGRFGPPRRDDRIFVRVDGSPLSANALSNMVRRWESWAGIGHVRGAAAHRLRHTYAVGLLLNGVSVPELSELLGHQNIETTGLYLKVTAAHLGDAAQAAPVRGLLP